jgi:hypothetical protein
MWSVAMKKWMVCLGALAVVLPFLTAERVSAQSPPYGYHCSIYPPTFDTWYEAYNGNEAVSYCQYWVNQQAIAYCAGQGTTDPWVMQYAVAWMPNYPSTAGEYYFHQSYVVWRCVDGWPIYA